MAVAVTDHAKQIAVFECLQRLHIVGLLQAKDIRTCLGDRKRGHLPGVVGMRDRAGLFEPRYSASFLIVKSPRMRS